LAAVNTVDKPRICDWPQFADESLVERTVRAGAPESFDRGWWTRTEGGESWVVRTLLGY